MADMQSIGTADSSATLPPKKRNFSLISFFTNNSNSSSSKAHRKSKRRKPKERDLEAGSVPSTSKSTQPMTGHKTAALHESKSAPVVATLKVGHDGIGRLECPLCFDERPTDNFPELDLACHHRSCDSCMEQYLKMEISESRVDITCPECSERLHPADIQKILKSDFHMSKYEEFMLRRVLLSDPDTRWCPAPDCGYAVIAAGCAGCPTLQCERPGCNTLFCYHCKQEWHANQTCEAARLERLPILRLSLHDSGATSAFIAEEYKPCPRCKTIINKMDDGSCNHMTCSMCNAQFCWLCLKEASDLHYLSPSGCTFWGKKPWSRKKKILWQLGTLIGAPVAIALIAGISVPLFVIGLPIVAGRKLYRRFKSSSRHKRNAVVTFGTLTALVFSPVIAALTIAIGVPILLAYVYGVVPISLCRGSACGVKSDNGTLSFDLGGVVPEQPGKSRPESSEGKTVVVVNPSIGPGSIGEASLVTSYHALSASGIQMDSVGLNDDQSDRQSASIRNVTSNSVNGSIYYPEPETATQPRLEIQVDVNQSRSVRRKNSIDSGLSNTDSRSLGPDNRSIRSFGHDNRSHIVNSDNASIKALAGSISAPKDTDGQSVILATSAELPVTHVQPDVRSKSCIRADHGSPVSNRSVSFAAAITDKPSSRKPTKKHKKLQDAAATGGDRAERMSQRSFDTLSNHSMRDRSHSSELLDLSSLTEIDSDKPNCTAVPNNGGHFLKRLSTASSGSASISGATRPISPDNSVLDNIIEDK